MKFKKYAVKMVFAGLLLLTLIGLGIVYFSNIVDIFVYLLSIFAPFIIAYGISLVVSPLAEMLQKKFRLPKGLIAVLMIILIVGIVGTILTGLIWKIVSEVKSIYLDFPQIYQSIVTAVENFIDKLSRVYAALPSDFKEIADSMGESIQSTLKSVNINYKPVVSGAGAVAKMLPSIFIVSIVFILSLFFMISNPKSTNDFVKKLVPNKAREQIKTVGGEIKKYLGGYVKAQLIIMSISFVIVLIGLSILRVKYSMLIALGVAVFDALPFFGSGAVLIPWSLISFISADIKMGIGMLIIYLSVIFIRQLVEPKIVSSNIGINPLLTLVAMYVGYRVFSLGGMILGPVVLMIIVSFYKAGAFDGLIRLFKGIFVFLKTEIKNLYDFITMR